MVGRKKERKEERKEEKKEGSEEGRKEGRKERDGQKWVFFFPLGSQRYVYYSPNEAKLGRNIV